MNENIRNRFRCDCPITSALDILGDKWTLVIIKQMLLEGKRTFKNFTESYESIATNILSSRLKMLEEFEIIRKEKLPDNRKTNIYTLTERGLELAPIIVELALWSDSHAREYNSKIVTDPRLELAKKNKEEAVTSIIDEYRERTGYNTELS